MGFWVFSWGSSRKQFWPYSVLGLLLWGVGWGWESVELNKILDYTMGQSPKGETLKGETFNENENGILFFQGRSEFGQRFKMIVV